MESRQRRMESVSSREPQPLFSQYMDKGVYVLLLQSDTCSVTVGGLGIIRFHPGWHAYVGSAQGPGGFARVVRHIRVNREKNRNPRWHIDYLLLSPFFHIARVYCIKTDQKIECSVSHFMDGRVVSGFGSSDCSCPGHLFYYPSDPHHHILHIPESLSEKGNGITEIKIYSP